MQARHIIWIRNLLQLAEAQAMNDQDIGISLSLNAYSNEVLAAIFSTDPNIFDLLTRDDEDVFIISGGA